MDNRKYNIYFHTHTISGIIICALLYVIFFAGSFSFFKDDISAWQKNSSYVDGRKKITKDYDHLLDSLAKKTNLKGRDFDFFMQRNGLGAYVSVSASNDSTLKASQKLSQQERKSAVAVAEVVMMTLCISTMILQSKNLVITVMLMTWESFFTGYTSLRS